jgi:fumarate reductase subunit C
MARRTYVRPMSVLWWRADKFFVVYMARELLGFVVVIYAAILLVTLARLAQGQASFERWSEVLASPAMILLHVLLVIAFVYHTWSWFRIMPKTMAPVVVAGRKLSANTITAAGLIASIAASAILICIVVALASI